MLFSESDRQSDYLQISASVVKTCFGTRLFIRSSVALEHDANYSSVVDAFIRQPILEGVFLQKHQDYDCPLMIEDRKAEKSSPCEFIRSFE